MACNEGQNSIAAAKKLIPLIIKQISNRHEPESLALINSRAELTFQLRLALFELGSSRPPSHNNERLSKFAQPLQEVLQDFIDKVNDGLLKTEIPPRTSQAALAPDSCEEAELPEQCSIRLSEMAECLTALAQRISGLRNPNSSRPDVLLDLEVDRAQMTSQEKSDVNKTDEGEKENECHNVLTFEVRLARIYLGSDCSVDRKVPATVESQETIDKKNTAAEFMDLAKKFWKEKIDPLKNKTRIKVAVLDTGVDKTELHFTAVRKIREGTSIKDVWSFTGDKAEDDDEHKHGTKVAALVVDIAPHVDLYIAKVSRTKKVLGVGQYVEAINWAIGKKVHIINISAAITAENENKIRDAINKAEAQNIIVFAAASNNGGNFRRAFPANMKKVLAIHATDGLGNPSSFNPTALTKPCNFSTLGEYIPSPLKKGGWLEPGTSFAAPIAVGMAANILKLAEEYLEDCSLRRLAFSNEGMELIFAHASERRFEYDYLLPVIVDRDSRNGYEEWFKTVLKYKGR